MNRFAIRPAGSARLGPALLALTVAALLAACAAVTPPERPPAELFPRLVGSVTLHSDPAPTQVRLWWRAVPGASHYRLYWHSTAGGEGVTPPIEDTEYTHTGLTTGATYTYRLTAADAQGRESAPLATLHDIPYDYPQRTLDEVVLVTARPNDTFASLARRYLGDAEQGWRIADFNGLDAVRPFSRLAIPRRPYERGGLQPDRYKTVPVLLYHRITEGKPARTAVTREAFTAQMDLLAREGYHVIPLSQLVDFLRFTGSVPPKAVAITFDDGWTSTYRLAWPVLRQHEFPATLFLYSGLVGSTDKALTWQQLGDMAADPLWSVQCHSASHESLLREDGESLQTYVQRVERELTAPRATLRRKLGRGCDLLAYPYGETNHLVVALAQKHGYRAGFTADAGSNPFFVNDYRLFRVSVRGGTSLQAFRAALSTSDDVVLR